MPLSPRRTNLHPRRFPANWAQYTKKTRMLSWQDIDKCLNSANDRVNWEGLVSQIRKIRETGGSPVMDLASAIESSLADHAIPYNKVFRVKETEALLPPIQFAAQISSG